MNRASTTEVIVGIHAVESALDHAADRIEKLVIAREARNRRVEKLADRARSIGIPVSNEPRSMLDKWSAGERHQDVLAEYRTPKPHGEKDLDHLLDKIDGPPLILVLDGVQDPHNLGACLRTADAVGVHFVILTRDRSAGLSPVARRAASGAAEVMPLLVATNLARVLRQLKDSGVWLVGTSDQAVESLYQADLAGPMALIMGSEGTGMRRLTAELCDFLVSIPMSGVVSSLNVSVATGVCLYEMNRQRNLS